MKQCIYCGKDYSDESSVCAIDGQPLRDVLPPLPASTPPTFAEKQQIIDAEHIKLLSIFHFVVAGLSLLGVAFLLVHYLFMSAVFSNPAMWKSSPNATPPPRDFLKIFVWFYFFMGALLITVFVLNLLSGYFLRQRTHRTFSIVVGGLDCLQIPFGTVLGVFTIIVLARDSVRNLYAAEPGAPPNAISANAPPAAVS
jgi:hypothetical protein